MIGLIESRPGEGTFIKKDPGHNILEPLSLMMLLEENSIEELVELRRVLEVDSVRLAAERIEESELTVLKKYIEMLRLSSGFGEESVEADRMFHYTIAKASNNKVLYYTMVSISEAMDFQIKNTRTKLVSHQDTMLVFLEQHTKIYNAIKAKDSSTAMQMMNEHLDYVEKLIRNEITG